MIFERRCACIPPQGKEEPVLIAYLDNSATTQPAEEVISAMSECMRSGYFNPSSLYEPALRAEKALNACRQEILAAVKRPDARVIFTSGGTESNNLAILGSVAMMRGPQRVVVSPTEHPSVLEAFDELERQGHTVFRLNVDGAGQIDFAQLEQILQQGGASLVSCMQVNNETGALLDARRLHDLVRKYCPSALIHVDGVQGFLRVPFDMKLADMYTISGHKLHGPKGCGALVVGKNVRLKARNMGGGQENAIRSGTENTPGIAGLHRAIQLMRADSGMAQRLMENKLYLLERFRAAIPETLVNGPAPEDAAPHIINLSFSGVRGEVMLHALEERQVYVSTGSACSSKKRHLSPVLLSMGIDPDRAECALRFSLSPHTTQEEIDYAAATAGQLYTVLRRFKRR